MGTCIYRIHQWSHLPLAERGTERSIFWYMGGSSRLAQWKVFIVFNYIGDQLSLLLLYFLIIVFLTSTTIFIISTTILITSTVIFMTLQPCASLLQPYSSFYNHVHHLYILTIIAIFNTNSISTHYRQTDIPGGLRSVDGSQCSGLLPSS